MSFKWFFWWRQIHHYWIQLPLRVTPSPLTWKSTSHPWGPQHAKKLRSPQVGGSRPPGIHQGASHPWSPEAGSGRRSPQRTMGIPNGTRIWPFSASENRPLTVSFRTTRDLLVEWKGIWIPDTHCSLARSLPSSYPFNFFYHYFFLFESLKHIEFPPANFWIW